MVAATQPLVFGLQLAADVGMGRFLTPADVGLIAMVTAITGFAMIFRDLGLGTIAVQAPTLTPAQKSNLFWINCGFGVLVALVVAGLSWPIALLYEDPRIQTVTLALTLSFIFAGASVQHAAMLRRDLRFGALAAVDLASLLIAGVIGVLSAALTHSYWALVAFSLTRQLATLVGVVAASRWAPSRYQRGSETLGLLRSGVNVAGFDVINYWSRNLDNVVVGRVLGAPILGVYKRAYDFLLLPLAQLRGPLTAVALPVLSQLHASPERRTAVFLDVVASAALLGMSLIAALLLTCEWLVPVVLGSQWSGVIPIFRYLTIAAVPQTVVGLLGLLLIATNQSRRYFAWGAVHALGMITSFVIGVQWGIRGLALAYGVANVLAFVPSIAYCTKKTGVTTGEFLNRSLIPLAATASAGLGAFIVQSIIRPKVGLPAAACVSACIVIAAAAAQVAVQRRRYALLWSAWAVLRSPREALNASSR